MPVEERDLRCGRRKEGCLRRLLRKSFRTATSSSLILITYQAHPRCGHETQSSSRARRRPRIDGQAAGNVVAGPPEPQFPAASWRKVSLVRNQVIDCAPTESIFTQVAYHASRYVLVPVKPEYFATIGFNLLKDSLDLFRKRNPSHSLDVAGIVVNNSTYHYSGNKGGPERSRAIEELSAEARKNNWRVFRNQIPLSRGFPKMMRGDFDYLGDAPLYKHFAKEFYDTISGH